MTPAKKNTEPAAVGVARRRLDEARARAREAQAARTHAEAEHRRLADALREHLHHAGRTGDTLDGVDDERLAVARAAQHADEARVVQLGAEQGARDAEHAVTQALIDHAEEMRAVLDDASDKLASEYAELQQAAAAFTGHMNEVRDRWEEYIRANEPDGTTRGWRRDAMRGDLILEADTHFRPRRAGGDGVLTSGRPGRTANAQAAFTT